MVSKVVLKELLDAHKNDIINQLSSIDAKVDSIKTKSESIDSKLTSDSSGNLKVNIAAQDVKPVKVGVHKSIEQKLSDYSLAGGGSVSIELTVPEGLSKIALVVKATYNSSASSGIRIKVYWSPDGSNWDTDTDEVYDHPFEAGKTKQKTYVIHALTPYVKIVIENLDPDYAVTLNAWINYI